jgi:hypothetical protein
VEDPLSDELLRSGFKAGPIRVETDPDNTGLRFRHAAAEVAAAGA